MINVTLTITSTEWVKLRDSARKQFPNETLSRTEIVRRYTLAGVDVLKHLSSADRTRLAHSYQVSMEAGDERLRT